MFRFGFSQIEIDFTPVSLSGPSLDNITDIVSAEDGSGKLYIVQKEGVIRIIDDGVVLTQEFLNISGLVESGGERGLLGLAFHPDYPGSPYIFVNYVIDNTNTTRIVRYTVPAATPDNADENSDKLILQVNGIQSNHKAGDLVFGPDGYLYITMGDGGGGGDPENTGQDFTRLLGKILRIDINVPGSYSIPADNPFLPYTGTGDTLPEIWMNGVRNPWRISFDRETGDMWIADVGQNLYEEINYIPAGTGGGRNLGWDCREGMHDYEEDNCPPGTVFTEPIFEYPHSCPCQYGDGISVTGGFVYRGNAYPDMVGYYVAVDFGTNNVFAIKRNSNGTFTFVGHNGTGNSGVTTFGEDENGELYAGNLDGVLYRVTAGSPLPLHWQNLTAKDIPGGNELQWTIHDILNIAHFEIQRSLFQDFSQFIKIGEVIAIPEKTTYTYLDPYFNTHGAYYRVAAQLQDGTTEYSSIAHIQSDPDSGPILTYDYTSDTWRINLPEYWQNGDLRLYDVQGRIVYNQLITDQPHLDIPSPGPPGFYFITIRGTEGTWSEKIVR